MEKKDDKSTTNPKVAEASAGLEKLTVSKKKKLKFVKVDPKELNIVIDDGRGRDTDFRNNNKLNHAKSQESRKHQDKGAGGFSRHSNPSRGEGAPSRNMSRGSSKHPSASSNYKADFEVNEDSTQQHKKNKRETNKTNTTTVSQQNTNDKEFKNNLMWEGDSANAKKSRNQWKNLEVNNITNKTRDRLMIKPVNNTGSLIKESGDVDSRTTTASILDSSLYQNTYDSKTRNFVDGGNQMFNASSTLSETATELTTRDDKLFSNEALYAPSSTPNYSYPTTSGPSYAAMTTASNNANNATPSTGPNNSPSVYSTNSFMAATTHGYSSITNTPPSQQQSNNSVYSSSINSYSSFPQQSSNSYGQEDSNNTLNNNYSPQNLYQQQQQQPTSVNVNYSTNSYVYPQTSVANSVNPNVSTNKYPSYGVDMKNHLEPKSSLEPKSTVEHPPYVDYPSYMGTQYQESLLKDVKTPADPIGHFEFRNTLDIAPMIPMDSYMTNYMQPGPPPQSTSDYKMLYWNNVPMPNILHAPPPQPPPPHSAMYKYPSHIPYDMQPTSQAAQKPFMKLNDSTASTDTSAYMSPTHVRVIPTAHRYPMDTNTTNKIPLGYTEPQSANLQSSLNEYQRYQNERHHFSDFGTFQTPPLGSSVQHNYPTNDTFGTSVPDLPTRIHQQTNPVHPYFNNTEDSVAQRYGAPNKRAITGGSNQRTPHYQHYSRHEDKDAPKPPVPHTSGNIFVNHNYPPPTVLPQPDIKLKKVVTTTVATSSSTSTTTAPASLTKPIEPSEKRPIETPTKEPDQEVHNKKHVKSPVKSNNANQQQQSNEKLQKTGAGGERQRERGGDNGRHHNHHHQQHQQGPPQFQNNMIKTIDFNQFHNNVMKNHPGHNKNFRPHNKAFGDSKNKEFKVTKIMQRPVDENKDEIAKLPIPLGVSKTEEKKSDEKKVEDENNAKDNKTPNSTKKTNKQENVQILSPAKKANKESTLDFDKVATTDEFKNATKVTDNKTKSKDDKENKPDEKSKDASKDISKTNKKDEGVKENKQQQQQQRRKFNNNFSYSSKYQRHPYHNNGGDYHYVPMYDGNVNKFNKFNGGNNRYPPPRYYDFDIIDPRSCYFPGGGPPYQQYGGGGGPPMYNNLYNGNNYVNNKKQKKDSINEQAKPIPGDKKQSSEENKSSKKQQGADESKKSSNKKIKFKGPEILNESSSLATSSDVTTPTVIPTTTDNSNNPSSILKKSKTNEDKDCKVKDEKKKKAAVVGSEEFDEREPSSIQVSAGQTS
uniref:Uncharacterized protein n=1 Tax=Cacopsylla melanoneura TaxID=428564 RepID=A0A8D9BVB3_9HEMI